MIKRFEFTGVHTELDENLEKYAYKKIGQLDRFINRSIRNDIRAEVKFKEGKAKDNRHSTCEVILHLPRSTLMVSESTINMYAAIDIVETKLKQQLKKYKDLHTNPKFYRQLLTRLRKS